MPSILAYHRPNTIDEAARLLATSDHRAVGGGTVIVPQARKAAPVGISLVDLQSLDLDGIEAADRRLRVGAMVRVGSLLADERVPALLQTLARRELPSTLRHQATIGGTVAAADADSLLLAGLLVHDAIVEFHDGDPEPLSAVLATVDASGVGGRLITAITIAPHGAGAVYSTGRTPADVPIVAAVGRRVEGEPDRVALTGVAPRPLDVQPGDPMAGLTPAGDFRGSADYRRHLALVLTARVVAGLDTGAVA